MLRVKVDSECMFIQFVCSEHTFQRYFCIIALITDFLCPVSLEGNLAFTLNVKDVPDVHYVARSMTITAVCAF